MKYDHPEDMYITDSEWRKAFFPKLLVGAIFMLSSILLLLIESVFIQAAGIIGIITVSFMYANITLDFIKRDPVWVMFRTKMEEDPGGLSVGKFEVYTPREFHTVFWRGEDIVDKGIIWFTPRARVIIKKDRY